MRSLIAVSAVLLTALALGATNAAALPTSPKMPDTDLFKADAHEKAQDLQRMAMKEAFAVGQAHSVKMNTAFAAAGAARAFDAQQVDTTALFTPGSTETQCTDGTYSKAVLLAFLACTGVTLPIANDYATDALATADWTTFCSSTCLTGFKDTLEGTKYEVCMSPDLKFFVKSSIYFCDTVSTTGGEKCGVINHRLSRYGSCDGLATSTSSNSTSVTTSSKAYTCAEASDVCESATKSVNVGGTVYSKSYCRSIYSTSVAAAVCDGGCLSGYVTLVNTAIPGTVIAKAVALLPTLQCAKDTDGSYCSAVMSATRNAFDSGVASKATFTTLCTSTNILGCYRKVLGLSYGFATETTKKAFQTCATSVKNVTASVNTYCVPFFKKGMGAIKEAQQTASKMCVTNTAGDYCMFHRFSIEPTLCYQYSQAAATQGVCTTAFSSCAAELNTAVTAMGCCAGLLQEGYSLAHTLTAEEYPKVTGYTAMASSAGAALGTTAPVTIGTNEEAVTMTSGRGFLANLAFCGATDLNQTLSKRCKRSTTTVAKKLGLKIKWSALSSDSVLKAKILIAVRSDIANNLGLSTEEIVNDDLVENSNIKVTTTAGRTMAIQTAGSGSGTNYEFEIQGADETTTSTASASYDTIESDNTFVMTETSTTTSEECGDSCTDSTESLTTSSSTSSGAASTFAGLAVLVASVIAMMM